MFKKNPFKKTAPARTLPNNINTATIANKTGANPQNARAAVKKPSLPPNYLDPKLF